MPIKAPTRSSEGSKTYVGSGRTDAGGGGGGGKKLSSLSSFQPKLKFSLPPAPSSTSGSSSGSGATSRSAPKPTPMSMNKTSANAPNGASRDISRERELMPPPPADYVTKTKARSISPEKPGLGASSSDKKGEGRMIDATFGEDEDDEIQITGSSPSKKRQKLDTPGAEEMWTELYAPNTIADLAPGRARVAKVQNWIHEALYGYPMDADAKPGSRAIGADRIRKYKRILLLSGPAGAGKTTTVKVIAKEMGIDLLEWGEGADESTIGPGTDRESSTSKLVSFLSRHSYSPLNVGSNASTSTSLTPATARPRLILLTGLPNLSHLPTREAFHATLLGFCQTFSKTSCPMVIVHSDAGSGGRAEESWMDRDKGGREGSLEVLGRSVKEGPWCQEIEFIPVAPTFITKALTQVLQRDRERARPGMPAGISVPSLQLIAITCNGDLRSAVNSLQLLGTQSKKPKLASGGAKDAQTGVSWSRRLQTKGKGKGSRGGKGAKLDVDDELRAALDALTRREQNLGLFHAVGKVLYNKRLGDPGEDKEDQEALAIIKALPKEDPLPKHLSAYERRKSMIQLDEFLPTIPVDTSSLALWLHECTPKFVETVEQAGEAIDDLCRADIMRSDDDIWQASPQAIAYALNITIRGTLMALSSPVPRTNQKITKPQFFDAYNKERDNITNLDTASAYIVKKAVHASVALSDKPLDATETNESAWGGLLTRFNLATEMIPMMIKIQNASGKPLLPATVQRLAIPPYLTPTYGGMEIDRTSAVEEGDAFEESAAGEDGLGIVDSQGGRGVWDELPDYPEAEEEDGAAGDEIEEWD